MKNLFKQLFTTLLLTSLPFTSSLTALAETNRGEIIELIEKLPKKELNGRKLVQVSLNQLLTFILIEGYDLQVAKLQSDITSSAARSQKAAFSPIFSTNLTQSNTKSVTSSNISGATNTSRLNLLSIEAQTLGASLSQKADNGISYSLSYQSTSSQADVLTISDKSSASENQGTADDPLTTEVWSAGIHIPIMQGYGEVNRLGLKRSETAYQQQLSSLQLTKLGYIKSIGEIFWDMVGVYANIDVLKADVKLAEDFVQENRERLAIGVIDELSLEQSLSQLSLAKQRLLSEKLKVREVEDQVKSALSLENVPYGLYPSDKPVIKKINKSRQELKELTLKSNPYIHQIQLEKKQAHFNQIEADNLDKPDVDLSLEYQINAYGQDRSEAASRYSDSNLHGYLVNLSWKVPFGNVLAREKSKQSSLATKQLELKEENLVSQLSIQLASYLRKLDLTEREVKAAGVTRELMKNILEKENEKFRLGLSSSFQVTQAQKDFSSAQRNEILAKINFQKNQLGLLVLTGQVWDFYQLPKETNQ